MINLKRTVTVLSRTILWLVVASGARLSQGPVCAQTSPTLASSYPANNAVNILSLTPMILTFDTDMAPQESVQWSSNIDPTKVTYTWEGSTTLMISYGQGAFPGMSSWPANATVTWTLNPNANDANNFRDTSGQVLAIGQYAGAFSTGSTISTAQFAWSLT